ncbi:MAG: hypothetical protein GWP04_12200 [Gammaproteobacteria bacterium]|nr:hypothetical protein [Gammaproteobacteria bacterium]
MRKDDGARGTPVLSLRRCCACPPPGGPEATRWGTRRFPNRFLRLLSSTLRKDIVSVPTVAEMMHVAVDEVAALLTVNTQDTPPEEVTEFEDSGVAG